MKHIPIFLLVATLMSCSKNQQDENPMNGKDTNNVIGEWRMTEVRADPGDGTGRFIPTQLNVTISFKEDGTYKDSRDQLFNRFDIQAADSIKLYSTDHAQFKLLALQDHKINELVYFTNWPWCGGPYGEKFERLGGSNQD